VQSTEFSITPEGVLRIVLISQGQRELSRLLTAHPNWEDREIFIELIDHQLTHGWYVLSLSQVRARTLSWMLTQSMTYDERGNLMTTGDVYWYPQHEVERYTAVLLKQDYIIFEKGN